MHKDGAKELARRLKSKSYTVFAFAPNGDTPILLVDKLPIPIAAFKKRSEEDAGIVFKEGAILLGAVARAGDKTVFTVDVDKSQGAVDAKRATRGLRKLRVDLAALGVKAPELAKFQVVVGDETVEDDAKDKSQTGKDFPDPVLWTYRLEAWDSLGAAIELANAKEPDLEPLQKFGMTLPEACAKLAAAAIKIREEAKLAVDKVGGVIPEEHKEALKAAREHWRGLLEIADANRAEKHRTLTADEQLGVEPLKVPATLPAAEKHINPLIADLNKLMSGAAGERNVGAIVAAAFALAQACASRLKELKGRWFKDKAKMAAILDIQRQAEETASALQARAAGTGDAQALLATGEREKTDVGVNQATFLKKDGNVEYLVKRVPKNEAMHDEKAHEVGREVASSGMGDVISNALGIPRMITPTFATRVKTDEGSIVTEVQNAWDAVGSMADVEAYEVQVGNDTVRVSKDHRHVLRNLNGVTAIGACKHYLGKKIEGWTDEKIQELHGKIVQLQEDQIRKVIEYDEDDIAEDIAHTAIVDILTGQRDHREGKEDNLLLVRVDGKTRLRPIDFGMTLHPPEHLQTSLSNFGAWSTLKEAARPLPKELIDNVLQLDGAELAQAALDAAEKAAKATQDPALRLSKDEAEMVRIQTVILQKLLVAGRGYGIDLSPAQLGAAFADPIGAVLFAIQEAAKSDVDNGTQTWRQVADKQLQDLPGVLTKWLTETYPKK